MPTTDHGETQRQKLAFEDWYNGGRRDRTYQQVANAFGVTKLAVYNWSQKYKWKARAIDRDSKIMAKIEDQIVDDLAQDRLTYLRIIRSATGLIAERIENGEIKVSLSDLDKLVRLSEFLHGEPDSRSESITLDKLDVEIRKLETELNSNRDIIDSEAEDAEFLEIESGSVDEGESDG